MCTSPVSSCLLLFVPGYTLKSCPPACHSHLLPFLIWLSCCHSAISSGQKPLRHTHLCQIVFCHELELSRPAYSCSENLLCIDLDLPWSLPLFEWLWCSKSLNVLISGPGCWVKDWVFGLGICNCFIWSVCLDVPLLTTAVATGSCQFFGLWFRPCFWTLPFCLVLGFVQTVQGD